MPVVPMSPEDEVQTNDAKAVRECLGESIEMFRILWKDMEGQEFLDDARRLMAAAEETGKGDDHMAWELSSHFFLAGVVFALNKIGAPVAWGGLTETDGVLYPVVAIYEGEDEHTTVALENVNLQA